jgi:beta-lactamase regulating signal transducer with metallopeptidase domain
MTIFTLLADVPASTWLTAADAVLKATVALATAALASRLLRHASASARHAVWTLGLAGALLVPVLSLALPRWHMPIVTLAPAADDFATSSADTRPEPALRSSGGTPVEPRRTPQPQAASAAVAPRVSFEGVLLIVWAAGVLALLARLAAGLVAVQWMSRRMERVTDARWLPLARDLAAELGVADRVTFLRSRQTTMPMALGMLRPSVVMPEAADTWPDERLRIVLLHELAHVRRRDCLTHALAQAACALYWFNPLAWMAARQVRTERERACDDLVLAAGTRGSEYADQLHEIARVMSGGRSPAILGGASLAMAHRSQLEGRLLAILDPSVPRTAMSKLRTATATAAFACAVMPLAAVQPWGYDAPAAPQAAKAIDQRPTVETKTKVKTDTKVNTKVKVDPKADVQIDAADVHDMVSGAIAGSIEGALEGVIEGTLEALGQSMGSAAEAQGSERRAATRKPVDPRTVAALRAALKDVDKDVRETALHTLVQLRDPAVFEPLVQALQDAAADVREMAAFGLGQLRESKAVPALIGALKDGDADVREQAAFALGQIRDRSAVDALIVALKDANPDVREQAAFALGQLRDERAIDALTDALKDAAAQVRQQAAFALGRIAR